MKNKSAKELLDSIGQLLNENHWSIMSYERDKKDAQVLYEQYKEAVNEMIIINNQLKLSLSGDNQEIDISAIKNLRNNFDKYNKIQQKKYTDLMTIYQTLVVSFEIEKKIIREYFVLETDQVLDQIKQDSNLQEVEELQQMSDSLISEFNNIQEQ